MHKETTIHNANAQPHDNRQWRCAPGHCQFPSAMNHNEQYQCPTQRQNENESHIWLSQRPSKSSMAPALLQCSALPPTLEAFCTRVEVPTRVRVHDFGTAWLVCVLHCDSTSIGVALVQAAGVFSARLTGNRSRRKPVIACAGDSGVHGSGHKRGSTRCVPKD